jgi:hypothetical protein
MIGKLWLAFGAFVVVAVGVVAFVSLGRGVSGSPAQRLSSWVGSTNLGQDIGTLEGDAAAVHRALDAGKGIVAAHTVCAAMATSAQTFNDDLPSPDTSVTQLLAHAYGLEYDAAEACYRAPSAGAKLFDAFARRSARAAALFGDVLRRVRLLTGATVPTTTTTVLGSTATSIL